MIPAASRAAGQDRAVKSSKTCRIGQHSVAAFCSMPTTHIVAEAQNSNAKPFIFQKPNFKHNRVVAHKLPFVL